MPQMTKPAPMIITVFGHSFPCVTCCRQRFSYITDILPVGKSSAPPEALSSECQQDHERFLEAIHFHND
jgi:hypothetical protein